jgi:hypothetical protein
MGSQSGFNPLNCSRAALQHVGYSANALAVIQQYRNAVVDAFLLALSNALFLTAATVFLVLTGDHCEHVEQHTIDRCNHSFSEVIHPLGFKAA